MWLQPSCPGDPARDHSPSGPGELHWLHYRAEKYRLLLTGGADGMIHLILAAFIHDILKAGVRFFQLMTFQLIFDAVKQQRNKATGIPIVLRVEFFVS